VLLLLSFASHAAMHLHNGFVFPNDVDRLQYTASGNEVAKLLARVDREAPGVIPLPHDNISWKERIEE
ncbi:MAG: hypothetical protein ACYTE3_12840, partial [Planctomycetota bacterium]